MGQTSKDTMRVNVAFIGQIWYFSVIDKFSSVAKCFNGNIR